MDVVFCADRRVLPGLHVAAWSLLNCAGEDCLPLRIHLFSDSLDEGDRSLLEESLQSTGKSFQLKLHEIDPSIFHSFPSLNCSWATYYRLHAATVVDADRFLYLDADTLCDIDITPLVGFNFEGKAAAWVPEAPMSAAVDRGVADQLGNIPGESYFNAGVMLINSAEWRKQKVSERAMDYVAGNRPAFHDQSALNIVLYRNAAVLDQKFNTIANMRQHWPLLRKGFGNMGAIIHFVDYPKPWDFLAELASPYHAIWRRAVAETRLAGFRSWVASPSRRIPRTSEAFMGYKKALKDKVLLSGYQSGLVRNIKGIK